MHLHPVFLKKADLIKWPPRQAHLNVQWRTIMNWNIVDENWQQFKRRLRDLWGKLVGENRDPSVAVG
jgi:hypothetical protein